jgi:hypothetical protein
MFIHTTEHRKQSEIFCYPEKIEGQRIEKRPTDLDKKAFHKCFYPLVAVYPLGNLQL